MKSITILIIFIFLSSSVYAAGGGGGGSGSIKSIVPIEREITQEPKQKEKQVEKPCNKLETRFERINCRLEKKFPELNTIEESCIVFSNPENCQNSYKKVLPCYDIKGPEKNKCFKSVAFTNEKANIKNQNKEQTRNYMVFLLYDIQEKIEDAYKERKITSREAAVIIDTIIKIKQDLFINKQKFEIKPQIEELKTKINNLNLQ